MNHLKTVLICILTITLPMTQAYAVIPDPHSVLSDAVEQTEESQEINISAPEGDQPQIPTGDLLQVQTIISGSSVHQPSIEVQEDMDDLLEAPIDVTDDEKFWTNKKIVITSSVLLTAGILIGLLLLLAGGGGSGSGAGSGGGAGGGFAGLGGIPDGDSPIIPPADLLIDPLNPPFVPHHNPEPSTFLLMGLGLLVPILRKRFSL